jgi:hypothetical protein
MDIFLHPVGLMENNNTDPTIFEERYSKPLMIGILPEKKRLDFFI